MRLSSVCRVKGAAVLKNFRLEACEGQTMDLSCPENTTISVGSLSLQRGETWKDEENIGCPPLPSAIDYYDSSSGVPPTVGGGDSASSTEHRHGHRRDDEVENEIGARCPMTSMQVGYTVRFSSSTQTRKPRFVALYCWLGR